jgi:hypothetical protein
MAPTGAMMLQTRSQAPTAKSIRVTLPSRHSGQRRMWDAIRHHRFSVEPCGRGFGKSDESVRECGDDALAGLQCNYGAPDYKRVEEVYNRLRKALGPALSRFVYARRLELVTGGTIEFWTLNDRTAGQSRHPDRWIIDEFGLVPHLRAIVEESIMPSLASRKGHLRLRGTPKGHNDAWHFWQLAGDDVNWARFTATSYDNPLIDPLELDRMRDQLTEDRFRQEIMAQFLEDGAGVFRHIKRAIYKEPMLSISEMAALALTGVEYQISVDCGKQVDYTVFTVIDLSASRRRIVYVDRRQDDYIPQANALAALCTALRVKVCVIETNGNEAFIELALRAGVPVVRFTTTNASKQRAVDELALAFEHETIGIPDFDPLVNELMAFEGNRLPSGLMRYEAPEGQHDDCVMSLAIGWTMIEHAVVWDLTREAVQI